MLISGTLDQMSRIEALGMLKQFQCRVVFTTDLTARGIDAQNVDLVINADVSWEASTHLHRIGRAGRFGTYALAITICSEGEEYDSLRKIAFKTGAKISVIPGDDSSETLDLWDCDFDALEKVEPLECSNDQDAVRRVQEDGDKDEGKANKRRRSKRSKKEDQVNAEEEQLGTEAPDLTLIPWVPVDREVEDEEGVDEYDLAVDVVENYLQTAEDERKRFVLISKLIT